MSEQNWYFDDDGYPSLEALDKIASWDVKDCSGLFEFIHALWKYPDYYVLKKESDNRGKIVQNCYLSTGGWSGNESIIEALQSNNLVWSLCWVQSRRGGHYIFQIFELDNK
jgi:hypothetical protein